MKAIESPPPRPLYGAKATPLALADLDQQRDEATRAVASLQDDLNDAIYEGRPKDERDLTARLAAAKATVERISGLVDAAKRRAARDAAEADAAARAEAAERRRVAVAAYAAAAEAIDVAINELVGHIKAAHAARERLYYDLPSHERGDFPMVKSGDLNNEVQMRLWSKSDSALGSYRGLNSPPELRKSQLPLGGVVRSLLLRLDRVVDKAAA